MLLLGRFAVGNKNFIDSDRYEQFQVIEGYVHYPQDVPYYRDNKPENLDSVGGKHSKEFSMRYLAIIAIAIIAFISAWRRLRASGTPNLQSRWIE